MKMNALMLLVFLTIPMLCLAQFHDSLAVDCNALNTKKGETQYKQGHAYSGACLLKDKEEVLKLKKLYVNGVQQGLQYAYYKNGKVKSETSWVNGKSKGLSRSFYKDGVLSYEVQRNELGNKSGKEVYYNKDGSVQERLDYINGKIVTK